MSSQRDLQRFESSRPSAPEPRPSGVVPRGTHREAQSARDGHASHEETTEDLGSVRVSMRAPRGTADRHAVPAPHATAERAAGKRESRAPHPAGGHEAEFFSSGESTAAVWSAEDWEDLDDAAISRRVRQVQAQSIRREKYQQRVLYAVTAAACFTALGLMIELQRQKGRAIDVASAAQTLSTPFNSAQLGNGAVQNSAVQESGARKAAPANPVAQAVAPVLQPVVAQPVDPNAEAASPASETQIAEVVIPAIVEVGAPPGAIPKGAATPGARAAVVETPRAVTKPALVQPVAVLPSASKKTAAPTLAGRVPAPIAAAPRAAAAPVPKYTDSDLASASPEVTRNVRPAQPSEKPPTRSFPAIN